MQMHASNAAGHGTRPTVRQHQQRCRAEPRHRHHFRSAVCASKKTSHAAQDTIREARKQQIQATDLLARLLQAPDAKAIAAEHVDSLTEEFFIMSSTYLDMARKEGNPDVSGKLEQVIQIAMGEKQNTLRPEIQLLNTILACSSQSQRQKVYVAPDTVERLTMNDRYFFRVLLDRMIQDVKRQQPSANQAELHKRLQQIKAEAERIVAQAP